jgi:protein-S-isoprenylcysteine O-methyltransferase
MVELVFLVTAFSLLFDPRLRPGVLGARVMPDAPLLAWAGVVLTVAGVGFSLWARFYLGSNWSASVTVKRNHTLVCSGPYAMVRHPIYAGFLLASIGTAMAFGEAGCFAAPPLLAFGWMRKWKLEEEFMQCEFGAAYTEYSSRVKRVIPFLW